MNGQQFSTKDVDDDTRRASYRSCTLLRHGGWWYWDCTYSNLNEVYLSSSIDANENGIYWDKWHDSYSLNACAMMVQRH